MKSTNIYERSSNLRFFEGKKANICTLDITVGKHGRGSIMVRGLFSSPQTENVIKPGTEVPILGRIPP